MTDDLALDARNWLAQQPSVTALLGSDDIWDTWIFSGEPQRRIENTQRCAIVIFVDDAWSPANAHNTLSFPRLVVDVWADPTRDNVSKAIKKQDAKAKVHSVYKAVDKFLHTVNMDNGQGGVIQWGSPSDLAADRASRIISSARLDGFPSFSPVKDGNGAWMGRVRYGVTL